MEKEVVQPPQAETLLYTPTHEDSPAVINEKSTISNVLHGLEAEFATLKAQYEQLVKEYDDLAKKTQTGTKTKNLNPLRLRVLGDELRDVIGVMDVKVTFFKVF